MGERLKAAIQRWRQRRKRHRRENPGHDIGKAVRANELDAQLRREDYRRWQGSGF